jgi:FSR family fosmidomycin resistance protein-like MFS transporter
MAETSASIPVQQPAYGRVSLLSWAHFVNDGANNYLPGILPIILISLGIAPSLAGAMMAALLFGQGMQPLTGLLADRVGGKSFTLLGLGGSSVAAALIAFMPNLPALVVVLLILGIFNGFFHPQTLAAVRRDSGDRQGMAMSIFLTGGEIGRGLWPLIASALVTVAGLGSIWVLGIPGLLTLPFIWLFAINVPPRQRNAAKVRWGEHMRPLSLLVLFSSLRGIMLYTIITYVPVLWHAHGSSLNAGAAFLTVLMVVGIIGNLGGGWLSDHLGRRRIIAAGMGLGILSMIGFMLASGPWLWVLMALLGIGLFSTLPLTVLIGQDIVPENPAFGSGMALGLANALGAIGAMALGALAGVISIPAVLWAGVMCGVLALPLIAFMPREA